MLEQKYVLKWIGHHAYMSPLDQVFCPGQYPLGLKDLSQRTSERRQALWWRGLRFEDNSEMWESLKGLSSEGPLEPRDALNSVNRVSMGKDVFLSRWKVQCVFDELRMSTEWQIANSPSCGWCLGQKEAKPNTRILATKHTKDSLSGHLANPLEQGWFSTRGDFAPTKDFAISTDIFVSYNWAAAVALSE